MKIIDSEKPININDINALEIRLNILFPENLKKLYLKYNGGIEETGEKIIDEIYSIKFGKSTIELVRNLLQITEKSISLNYLIFATTGVGHQISIDTNNGEIVLFRKDKLDPEIITSSLEDLLEVKSIEDL